MYKNLVSFNVFVTIQIFYIDSVIGSTMIYMWVLTMNLNYNLRIVILEKNPYSYVWYQSGTKDYYHMTCG